MRLPGTYISPAESGLYYLNSRYYVAEVGRFISADGYISTGQGIDSNNMFAYCNNNPIQFIDPYGTCPYNGSMGDFYRLERGLPSMDCTCFSSSNKKPNFQPQKDKRKGSENRQPTGDRERNVGHPEGEEHSRVPKGNNGIRRIGGTVGVVVMSAVIIYLVVNDSTGIGVMDDAALVPAGKIWWDCATMIMG